MLTVNTRTPWGAAILLMCVLLFSHCRGGRLLRIEEGEVSSSAVPSLSTPSDPSEQPPLVASSSFFSPRSSALQVALEMPPTAPSPPQPSTIHVTPEYSQLPADIGQRIYIETVLRKELSDLAFGKQAWGQHFGDVGKEPPLPCRIFDILNSPCPFWADRKVKDTHLLVLIPATVNGKRFTLNRLGKLIKKQFPNNKNGYCHYNSRTRKAFGNEPLRGTPYWLLMTHKVLPGSLGKHYAEQQAMVEGYSEHGYRLPFSLEAATCILAYYVRSGACRERLFENDPLTYTRCTAMQLVHGFRPLVVGGFESAGLDVDSSLPYSNHFDGVACCRKL